MVTTTLQTSQAIRIFNRDLGIKFVTWLRSQGIQCKGRYILQNAYIIESDSLEIIAGLLKVFRAGYDASKRHHANGCTER